ncbi:MAG: DNA polymerase III subunit delta [Nonlabens sp.]|nr:DNA polymerase III subunit delta [Nonlabens sp.]MDP5101463.1 DNA polymerase III subunit delta [Nonlabens sp.]
MSDYAKILTDLKNKRYAPIYILYGDEPFFIDSISNYIEKNVLDEGERGFNQMVMYGKECKMSEVVENAKRFPMMAEHQVIIVKEAQHLSREWGDLDAYAAQPQTSTILVFNYKYKKPDLRLKVFKELKKSAVMMESKPLYENKVPAWINELVASLGFKIEPDACQMLVEFIGNDLSRIQNEMNKLSINLQPGALITPLVIEENIGISKDYNNFELRKALGARDTQRVFKIAAYFAQNEKDNPIVVTSGTLYSMFTQLLKVHAASSSNPAVVAKAAGVSPYFVSELITAARNYPMKYCSRAIHILRDMDMKSKGVNSHDTPAGDLLKEALVNILAP